MRKIGLAVGLVVLVLIIALAVRSQMRDPRPADGARPIAMAEQPVDGNWSEPPASASEEPVLQPIARNTEPSAAEPTQERPLVSDKLEMPAAADEADTEQDGATVLRRASTAYTNLRSLRADFVQRRENALLNSTITSKGTLYQRRPDRFLLRFSDPAGDIIVSDGRHFWLYYPSVDAKQVLRSPASQEDAGAVDLQSQFIGDPVKRFRHKYEGQQKVGGRNAHVLTLTPREDAGYRTLKVWVDASDHLVRRFQITEQTGALVEFQLSNLTANPTLPDALFRFTPPAGARVIDR